jgi:hypothetical protein
MTRREFIAKAHPAAAAWRTAYDVRNRSVFMDFSCRPLGFL